MDRRRFLGAASSAAAVGATATLSGSRVYAAPGQSATVIDTHMHVWSDDADRYPFPHPYNEDFAGAPCKGTVEMLIDDMDRSGCTHCVLVQVIWHGWDNSYVADCVARYPDRLKAHGLIDPAAPDAADKLEYWVKERGLAGMRFSPIYYQNGNHGGDAWLTADHTHKLWKTAAKLGAVLNFFIGPRQLADLAKMVAAHPDVRVIVDHLGQIALGAEDAEDQFKALMSMARFDNVWVKVSELTSVSASGKYPFVDARQHVRRVYEGFGPDRLLFGTGYPASARAYFGRPALSKEIDLFKSEMPFIAVPDRAKILGQNAVRLWGFDVDA